MKEATVTIRGVNVEAYQEARIISIKRKITMGQIVSEALRQWLYKAGKK